MGNVESVEFGKETRKQSQEGKISFSPFSTPPPPPPSISFLPRALTIPMGKLGSVSTPSLVESAQVFPNFKWGSLEDEGIRVNKQLGRFMGRSSIL